MMEQPLSREHIHITPRRSSSGGLGEVWRYRDLILLLTRRSFQLTYRQTLLGPAWVLLRPLLTALVCAVVFGGVVGVDTGGVPKLLFYLCGSGLWTFFSGCLTRNASAFSANAGLFGKVYFPRLTVPIANVLSGAIGYGAGLIPLGLLLGYHVLRGQAHPSLLALAILPLEVVHLGILGLGVGVLISSLTTRYRDLNVLVDFGVQLWMFASPVVYPLSQTGDGFLRVLLLVNPVTVPLEAVRAALLGTGTLLPGWGLLSWGITLGLAALGVRLFRRVERTFLDTV